MKYCDKVKDTLFTNESTVLCTLASWDHREEDLFFLELSGPPGAVWSSDGAPFAHPCRVWGGKTEHMQTLIIFGYLYR